MEQIKLSIEFQTLMLIIPNYNLGTATRNSANTVMIVRQFTTLVCETHESKQQTHKQKLCTAIHISQAAKVVNKKFIICNGG